MWLIIVLSMIILLLLVICYALLVMAYEEKERADRMYKAWKENRK